MLRWFRRGPRPTKTAPGGGFDKLAAQTRVYALILLAVLIVAALYFTYWYTTILVGDWCRHAVGMADKADARPIEAMGLCIELMTGQLEAVALNSHIMTGTLALVVAALAIIVVAKGRVHGEFQGVKLSLGSSDDPVAEAAHATADAAKEKADEITEAVAPASEADK